MRRKMNSMQPKPIKVTGKLFLNLVIRLGCIWEKKIPWSKMSQLQLKGDGSFQILDCFNYNTYKLNLSGEYNIMFRLMFSIFLLLIYVMHESRSNLLRKGKRWESRSSRSSRSIITRSIKFITCTHWANYKSMDRRIKETLNGWSKNFDIKQKSWLSRRV